MLYLTVYVENVDPKLLRRQIQLPVTPTGNFNKCAYGLDDEGHPRTFICSIEVQYGNDPHTDEPLTVWVHTDLLEDDEAEANALHESQALWVEAGGSLGY